MKTTNSFELKYQIQLKRVATSNDKNLWSTNDSHKALLKNWCNKEIKNNETYQKRNKLRYAQKSAVRRQKIIFGLGLSWMLAYRYIDADKTLTPKNQVNITEWPWDIAP